MSTKRRTVEPSTDSPSPWDRPRTRRRRNRAPAGFVVADPLGDRRRADLAVNHEIPRELLGPFVARVRAESEQIPTPEFIRAAAARLAELCAAVQVSDAIALDLALRIDDAHLAVWGCAAADVWLEATMRGLAEAQEAIANASLTGAERAADDLLAIVRGRVAEARGVGCVAPAWLTDAVLGWLLVHYGGDGRGGKHGKVSAATIERYLRRPRELARAIERSAPSGSPAARALRKLAQDVRAKLAP